MWLDMNMKKGPRLDFFGFCIYRTCMYYMEGMDVFSYMINMSMSVKMKENLSLLVGSFLMVIFL